MILVSGPTSLASDPTRNIANDLAVLDFVETSTLVLWLMNLFGTNGDVGQIDQRGLHDRNRPHQFRLWLELESL